MARERERARTHARFFYCRNFARDARFGPMHVCVWMLSQLASNFWVSLFIVASGAVCFPLHGCSLVIGPLIKVQLKIFARARAAETLITIKFMRIFASIHPAPSRAPRACIGSGVVACVNCIIKIASAKTHSHKCRGWILYTVIFLIVVGRESGGRNNYFMIAPRVLCVWCASTYKHRIPCRHQSQWHQGGG